MIDLIEQWIPTLWLVLLVIWILAAFASKRTVQRQTGSSRLLHVVLVFIGIALIFNLYHWFDSRWLATRVIPREAPYVLGGAIMTIAGLLFCIWARVVLGSNWSGTVTIKEHHELVRRGPYRIVRHPIYTGVLIGLMGTAFVYGFARCFVGALIVGSAFWLKSQIEEQFMVQQFGEQYVQYRREVRALIPYIL
ncbi:MAG: isoprenylcysteine carboxylmethyltransferase family protein [Silvibacterium sp.]|nr:isoprenylcysteine carboxylmethyltransferase family protein [Silvibacterium sp.]MBV8438232.1 isoprenylcysteine carboxylmethyltransferase family protein [Silvibacterium sp.]